jgi:hypothetical protein
MSDTEERASDDAVPDDPQDGPPADHEDEAAEAPEAPVAASDDPPETPEDPPAQDGAPEPSWWHRSHPTFAGLVGFFTGVAYVIIVPGGYAALLGLLVSDSTAQKLFPLVLVALVVPLAMLVPRKTRRFAQFMFLGIISTALVIALTSALVIWVLVRLDG